MSVDPQALRIAAARLDDAADILQTTLHTRLGGLHIDAGRLIDGVGRWERASRDLASALRSAADRLENSEAVRAEALR